jgi:hypothetical protein
LFDFGDNIARYLPFRGIKMTHLITVVVGLYQKQARLVGSGPDIPVRVAKQRHHRNIGAFIVNRCQQFDPFTFDIKIAQALLCPYP